VVCGNIFVFFLFSYIVFQNDAVMTEDERKEWKTKELDGFDAEFAKIDGDLAPLYNLTLVWC